MRAPMTKFKVAIQGIIHNERGGAYIPPPTEAHVNYQSVAMTSSLAKVYGRDMGSHTPSRCAMLEESDVTISVHSICP